ncbi:DUF4489 domain-containing protein [Vallitalea pronyensis]|uniref:DUF4489 domain-containing protein n=1 Tax=Vallitalea pronyensis TaxID=1348613 RepID=A0A8J8MNR6_9FIRM|nr:DUF4489 domain-containing protein [Vallitalea pronyensis]QUI24829.1 DUF4489 domain-containing protein [Vallitalea pronyensis]
MSYRNHHGELKNEGDKVAVKCKPNHTMPRKVLLECGEGTGSSTFTSTSDAPFQLAHVTLDTTYLNKLKVLIKFSSSVRMINLATNIQGGIIRLRYELFKSCHHENPILLGTWMYEEFIAAIDALDTLEETFSFNFCERTNCSHCCQYFVVVTPVEITNATVMVSNGNMAAFAQSLEACPNNQSEVHSKGNHKKEKHPQPMDILAVCGNCNGSVSFKRPEALPPSVGIAHVSVDTTCLINPKVLIEFACNISIISAEDVKLAFELFRVCRDGEPLSRRIWKYDKTGSQVPEQIEKIFNFTFCECKAPSSCCEYFVILTVNELSADLDTVDVTIDHARINAFAQSSSDHFNDDYKGCKKKGSLNAILKNPRPKEMILECGNGVGLRKFTEASTDRVQVGQVAIDTTDFCNPMVNIEFSSVISFETFLFNPAFLALQLQIELFRMCHNKIPVPIGVWVLGNFDRITRSTGAFQFIACDCITCPGCCDYFVTVTPFGTTEDTGAVTISDVRIAALAWES